MKLKALYRLAFETGIENDPRGENSVRDILKRQKAKYDKLPAEEKEVFDTESLSNPYQDSRILFSPEDDPEIMTVAVGIDIETPELVLIDRLKKEKKIDLALAHHPEGYAFANLYGVMGMQAEILELSGVPISIAEATLSKRISEVSRRLMPANHTRATDAAALLGIPFMSMHTPADNCVASYLSARFAKEKPLFVEDVVKLLESIPEYGEARRHGLGPRVISGGKERKCGKVYVDMTGGTEGSKNIFDSMAQSGIGTVVCMHLSEEHFKAAEKANINAVIAGHISSDTLGINLLLDRLEKKNGPKDFINLSGFTRIRAKR